MTEILRIENLQKRFGGLVATDNVTLDVHTGEIHALIGPNGAGKSTLINQLCGELRQDAGVIHLAGRDISHMPAPERVDLGLGRTFQVTSLLEDFTVVENVGLAVQARDGGNFRIFDRVSGRSSSMIHRSIGPNRVICRYSAAALSSKLFSRSAACEKASRSRDRSASGTSRVWW